MKSNAPLVELRRIVRMPDESARVHALAEWIRDHVAMIATHIYQSDDWPSEARSMILEHWRKDSRRSLAEKVSELVSEEEPNLGFINPSLYFSLAVIVPEGVEHPRKRQARERAELEAKEAAAS